MRAFVAINLPLSLKTHITESIQPLQQCDVRANWVATENLHMTVKFLGNIEEKQAEDIKQKLKDKKDRIYSNYNSDMEQTIQTS